MYHIQVLKIIIAITVLITLKSPIYCQFKISDPDLHRISSDSLQKMDNYFHQLVDNKRLAGIQTGVLHNDELVHFDSYGYSNIEDNKLLNENSIFRIFSMTKPIVSVALMQLFENGKFKLNDPLHKYIPEFRTSYVLKDSKLVTTKKTIRIIDLLRHTSGYSYGNNHDATLNEYYINANLSSAKTNEEFVMKLSKIPLSFEPGTNWEYGLSTNICGYLIEVLSGKNLQEYLHDSILSPLQMNDTYFQLPKDKVERFTTGYSWNNESGLYVTEGSENNRYTNDVTLFNGGGGLVSTTFDYLKFCQMLLNNGTLDGAKILNKKTIELMFSDHLEETRQNQSEPLRLPSGEASFGLGFSILGESPDKQKKVFGWGGAVGTYFKIDMDRKLAYVMMIQLSPYRQLELREKIQKFINASFVE